MSKIYNMVMQKHIPVRIVNRPLDLNYEETAFDRFFKNRYGSRKDHKEYNRKE